MRVVTYKGIYMMYKKEINRLINTLNKQFDLTVQLKHVSEIVHRISPGYSYFMDKVLIAFSDNTNIYINDHPNNFTLKEVLAVVLHEYWHIINFNEHNNGSYTPHEKEFECDRFVVEYGANAIDLIRALIKIDIVYHNSFKLGCFTHPSTYERAKKLGFYRKQAEELEKLYVNP